MTEPIEHETYAHYLQQRSTLGKLYRNYLLYPRLGRCVKGRVLDFGCGIGDFLLFRPGTVGVDINPHNVEFCRARGADAELSQEGRIPYGDGEFNTVVMDNVLEHIPKNCVDRVLSEVLRLLHPAGKLLIGVPGLKGYDSDDDHKCYYSEQDLITLLGRYGCRKVKSFHMPVHMLWLENHLSQYCIYVLFAKA